MIDLYTRQQSIPLEYIPSAIIVGVGGTGSWVAIFLVMSGCERISLFDDDALEPSNFNRLPLSPQDCVGQKKVEAIQQLLRTLRPDCQVDTFGRANSFSLATTEGQILFDCTDSQDTQTMLSQWAESHKVRYIRVGYNGTHMTVTSHVSSWCVGAPQSGYTIIPSWVVPAAMAACFGVAKAMYHFPIEITHDISDLGVEVC
jgi:molybdopterin/thiamine biosynthesis adenylyltransferase